MITCPICDHPLYLSQDERDSNSLADENSTADYYCQIYTDIAEGRRWCHYWRKQGHPTTYWAVIPPFDIHWCSDGTLEVQQFTLDVVTTHTGGDLIIYSTILKKERSTMDDFFKAIKRFKLLVPFS